jgi:cytochrome c oxidase cbb3-type subunit 1
VEWHFWISTIGIIFYMISMWFAGIMEGLMWRAYNEYGFLEYSFVETVEAKHISYIIRMVGGLLYFSGAAIMAYNLIRTALGHGEAEDLEPTENDIYANPQPRPALAPAE